MAGPKCIVCGKEIKKLMRGISFYPAADNRRQEGERSKDGGTIYLDERPRNKAEAQKYTNHEIVRVRTDHLGKVWNITWWEGEYEDPHFHSERCAAQYGRAMARRYRPT